LVIHREDSFAPLCQNGFQSCFVADSKVFSAGDADPWLTNVGLLIVHLLFFVIFADFSETAQLEKHYVIVYGSSSQEVFPCFGLLK